MFMLKSDDQRQKAAKRIGAIHAQIDKIRESHGSEKAEVLAKAMQGHLADLKEQIRAYDELKENGHKW